MKKNWTKEELVQRWTLFPDELALVGAKIGHTRMGFAVMLRFFAGEYTETWQNRLRQAAGELSSNEDSL